MKSKLSVIACEIIVCYCFIIQTTAEQTSENLNPAYQPSEKLCEAITSHEKNVCNADAFESVISNSTNAVELATARVYLASCLFHAFSGENADESIQRIYHVCKDISDTPLTQWQAAAAKVIIVATKALEGKKQESIMLSRAALETIDFETIEQEKSIAWGILKKDFHGNKYVLRETLKANIANELSDSGQPDEAEEVWRTISDGYFSSQMAERITDVYASQANAILNKQIGVGHDNQAIDHARVLFDSEVEELFRSGDWRSLSLPGVLDVVSKRSTNAVVAATAKVYLARYLLNGLVPMNSDDQKKIKIRRIYQLCNEVSDMPDESWQSGLMAWIVASAKHIEGKNDEAIAVAASALKSVDFESLEKNDDKAWQAIRKTIGENPFVLRESLNSVLGISQMKVEPEGTRQPVENEVP